MAIFELRTYSVIVGKMAEVTDLYKREGWPAVAKLWRKGQAQAWRACRRSRRR
jgi:hypothetical protein